MPCAVPRHPAWTAAMAYERDVARLRDGAVDGPDLRFRTRVSPAESASVAA